MGFDTAELFGNLYGAKAAMPEPIPRPEPVGTSAGFQVAPLMADWVLRPDCHGRMGWEAPGLPEPSRWWARCDFDDLPVVPVGFSIGELPKPAPRIAPGCDSGGMNESKHVGGNRPAQERIEGLMRA